MEERGIVKKIVSGAATVTTVGVVFELALIGVRALFTDAEYLKATHDYRKTGRR